ncbi:hypothetical protein F383_02665 [Gossypium arboreum]|uniref:Uncharacterized protein n=1 Tax=Gossypium arboreum TaxID=29729 RepID=A0A0B0PBM3_GOSAR|nr:hypothetical protein F383_02665 [Gossypium arboreum]
MAKYTLHKTYSNSS